MSYNVNNSNLTRTERKKLAKREQIIDISEKLFFEKGIENVSIEEISQTSDFSRRTIYKYFGGKEAIYLEIVYRSLKKIRDLHQEELTMNDELDGYGKVELVGKAILRLYLEFPNYCRTLFMHKVVEPKTTHGQEVQKRIALLDEEIDLIPIIREGIEDGSIRNDIEPELLNMVLFGGTMGSYLVLVNKGSFLNQKYKDNPSQFLKDGFQLLIELLEPRTD